MNKYSVVFMGTPDFSVPCLEMLINEGYDVKAVVCQPDRPKGRGNKVTFLPVKETALKYGIEVFQPIKIRDGSLEKYIRGISPDFIITVAYGRILPAEVLIIPKFGCVNVHASLLPKYRGAAPIQAAIINGESKSGITTMFMDEGMDTGDILLRKEVDITPDMTGGQLHDILSLLGAELLKVTLGKIIDGTIIRIQQDDAAASYVSVLTKESGHIDWSESSGRIYNLVRGVDPYPGAFTYCSGEVMKIWKLEVTNEKTDMQAPGTVYKVENGGIYAASGDFGVKITCVQFPSSKKMSVSDYLRGHKFEAGTILGEAGV